jgi:hypothetical protein
MSTLQFHEEAVQQPPEQPIKLPEKVIDLEDAECQTIEEVQPVVETGVVSTQTDVPVEEAAIDLSLYLPDVQRTLGIYFGSVMPSEVSQALDDALSAFGLEKELEAVFEVPVNVWIPRICRESLISRPESEGVLFPFNAVGT